MSEAWNKQLWKNLDAQGFHDESDPKEQVHMMVKTVLDLGKKPYKLWIEPNHKSEFIGLKLRGIKMEVKHTAAAGDQKFTLLFK